MCGQTNHPAVCSVVTWPLFAPASALHQSHMQLEEPSSVAFEIQNDVCKRRMAKGKFVKQTIKNVLAELEAAIKWCFLEAQSPQDAPQTHVSML